MPTYRVGQKAYNNALKRAGTYTRPGYELVGSWPTMDGPTEGNYKKIEPTNKSFSFSMPSNPMSKYEDQSFYNNMGNAYTAMEETQKRAGADRAEAISGIKGAQTSSLADYSQVPQDMITEQAREQMYNEGREVAEAERASMLRQLQRSSGGMPSGAAMEAAGQIDQAKMGTLANLKRKIGTEASEKNWTSRFQMAGATSGIKMTTADRLANVLGNTISAVPKYENPVKSMEAAQQQAANATGQNFPNYGKNFGITKDSNFQNWMKENPEAYKAFTQSGLGYSDFAKLRQQGFSTSRSI